MDVCEGCVEVGQEPPAQLGCLAGPVTTSTMARASVAAQALGSGSSAWVGAMSGRQATRGRYACDSERCDVHRNGADEVGREWVGPERAREAGWGSERGLGAMCVLMACPGEW